MKIQCPKCKKSLTVPKTYEGKKIRCAYCKEVIAVIKPVENPSPQPQNTQPFQSVVPLEKLLTKENLPYKNILEKFYSGIPAPFKISFFATIGVISALILCFYTYSHFIVKSVPISEIYQNDFEKVKAQINAEGLFLLQSNPEDEILRGRILRCYYFVSDATEPQDYFKLYFDESNKLCGISASWIGDEKGNYYRQLLTGSTIDDKDFILTSQRAKRIFIAFKKITEYHIYFGLDIKPEYDKSLDMQSYSVTCKDWKIDLYKSSFFCEVPKKYQDYCKRIREDPNLYRYFALAYNW